MSALATKVKEEFGKLLPPTLFFLAALYVLALVRTLFLKGAGISIDTSISVVVGALILGKAVLLADMLPFINRYPGKPLAFNIVWKTALYFLVALLIHYLERLIDFWREAGGFIAGNEKLLAQMIWPHFWAIQILLAVLIVSYCTMRELARTIGEEKMRHMFFGPMPQAAKREAR